MSEEKVKRELLSLEDIEISDELRATLKDDMLDKQDKEVIEAINACISRGKYIKVKKEPIYRKESE